MQWLLLWLWVSAASALELHCEYPECNPVPGKPLVKINGQEIDFSYEDGLFVGCRRLDVLESPAMPRFVSELQVSKVVLENCPIPRNTSIAEILARLNVTLHPNDGKAEFQLNGTPLTPKLTAQHFSGLQFLTNLTIKSEIRERPGCVSSGFLSGLETLRDLSLTYLQMKPGELQRLPRTITSLHLVGHSLKDLTGTIRETVMDLTSIFPNLRSLNLDTSKWSEAPITINETKIYNQAIDPLLESLTLVRWKQGRYPPMEKCNYLRKFEIGNPNVVEFPDRFIAACPVLEELIITAPRNIKEVPSRLLEGANALKSFSLSNGKIETLPKGFFQDLPNLRKVDLSGNQIRHLPSALFVDVQLQSLSMSYNSLFREDLYALAQLTSLTDLRLQSNSDLSTCSGSEYSPFQNMTQLKTLDLSNNYEISAICRDWRENLVHLEYLDLYDTGIQKLKYADLQYTRDASVKNAVVSLRPGTTIIFSQEDYNNSLTAPPTGATILLEKSKEPITMLDTYYIYTSHISRYFTMPECGCTEYWLRRAMDEANHAVKVEGFTCSNGRKLEDITAEQLCPDDKFSSNLTTCSNGRKLEDVAEQICPDNKGTDNLNPNTEAPP